MVLKFIGFSHLLSRFFGFGSLIGLGYISLVHRVDIVRKGYLEKDYLMPERRFGVKDI